MFWDCLTKSGEILKNTTELNELAHRIDPSRMTVAASYQEGSFNYITDAIAMNKYFGWYYDKVEDFGTYFDTGMGNPNAKIGLVNMEWRHNLPKIIPSIIAWTWHRRKNKQLFI